MNIQAQYRVFPDRLVEETSSLSLNEVKELDSKELTRTFMMKPDLYRNIEMVAE
jgi:CRISPR/Cas system-associated protein Csx1